MVILTIIQQKHHVTIKNGSYSMCNGNDCTVGKMLPESLLNQIICSSINRCSSFIKHQYLTFLKQHTAKADQLPLTHTPIFSILTNCIVQKNISNMFPQRNSKIFYIRSSKRRTCRIQFSLFLSNFISKLTLLQSLKQFKGKNYN